MAVGPFSAVVLVFILSLFTHKLTGDQAQISQSDAADGPQVNRPSRLVRPEFALQHILFHNVHDKQDMRSLDIQEVYPEDCVYRLSEAGFLSRMPRLELWDRLAQIYRPTTTSIKQDNNITARLRPPISSRKQPWSLVDVVEPDTRDKNTVISLAEMSSDAYVVNPSDPEWLNYSLPFDPSVDFGWNSNTLRGHVFANMDNSTIVIAIKGTSAAPGEDTRLNDRLNDNLLFSCCCASNYKLFPPVCSCNTENFKCNTTCLSSEIAQPDHYYSIALSIYSNVTALYPHSNIWLTGHSMGGVMASLLGLTYGHPAVTFETPPNALAAERLGLALPSNTVPYAARTYTGAYHFGNTADPVYMGACDGVLSACSWAGYALESQCFTGVRCVYDTVGDMGWRLSVVNHRINTLIRDVLKVYDDVANCTADTECIDCANWYFEE